MMYAALTVYGNYFEYSAIRRWLERNNTCPVTKKPLLRHMVLASSHRIHASHRIASTRLMHSIDARS